MTKLLAMEMEMLDVDLAFPHLYAVEEFGEFRERESYPSL